MELRVAVCEREAGGERVVEGDPVSETLPQELGVLLGVTGGDSVPREDTL